MPHIKHRQIVPAIYEYSFNPRPRVGGDSQMTIAEVSCKSFNPRPRVGSDAARLQGFAAFASSIHAPARGATPGDQIDGEPYWDGGYSGNPTMTPLIRECNSSDTLIVAINLVERPGTPRSAQKSSGGSVEFSQ